MAWTIAALAALLLMSGAIYLIVGHSRRITRRRRVQDRVYAALDEMRAKTKLAGGQGRPQLY